MDASTSAASVRRPAICALLARAISRSAAVVPGRSDARGRRTCAPRSAAWMRVAASPSTAASHCDERSVESASSLALPGLPVMVERL